MDHTFEKRRRFTHPRGRTTGSERDSSLRQRNELGLVGDVREAAALPVRLGLLDPLLGGGDHSSNFPPPSKRRYTISSSLAPLAMTAVSTLLLFKQL